LKSEEKYLEAIKIEREKDNTDVKYNLYDNLLRLAIQTNNFEKALYYQTIVDSLYLLNTKSANEKNIRNIEAQYKLQANEKSLIQEKKNNDKNKLIFIILFCLLILLILFLYQKNKSAKLKLSEEKLMLEQQILRSQMNPHFIFNALSAIQSSLLNNEPIQSAIYLSKFAILIRQNFDFINCRKIFLFEEIDALQNYMDTQKMRFEDKFNYEINICDDVDVNIVQIPPLLLQPFIENAIEHGFKNLK
ncbi:MAG: sensor histidine kinase, partial [Polaribacter sp.]